MTTVHNDPKNLAPPISCLEVHEGELVGKLYLPTASSPRPAIIVFSGSDGGFHEKLAQRFAQEGYVSFALAYFNAEGLPKNLEYIPLEYFQKGIRWLKEQEQVDPSKVHLYGPSRGGELVLLLASIFPSEFASVVAVVPSCVTYGGIPNEKVPTWTYRGKEFPIAPSPSKRDVLAQLKTNKTVDLSKIFLQKMEENPQLFEEACIKVEDIRAPLLVISGDDDRMWPSSIYADRIMKRLDRYHSSIFRQHLCYHKAGHMILCPSAPVITQAVRHPVTGMLLEVGGEIDAQESACKDSWKQILSFYKRYSYT